jgi:hypothetical protein
MLAVGVCYGFTVFYPFFFDDFGNIAGNPAIRDLSDPSKIIRFNPLRPVTYFTFALNYLCGGESVTGYHVVNILIHASNSILVWILARMLFQTQVPGSSPLSREKDIIAFTTALVFAVHPLMTEAVTYLVQRLVSLSTLFFLASFILYLQTRSGRLSGSGKARAMGGLVLTCLLAFFTRENTWVLPLLLLVAEMTFFRHAPGHRKWFTWLLILNIIVFLLIFIYVLLSGKYFKPIPPIETHSFALTAPVYYMTQVCAVILYLKLLVIPAGQVFDRDFPVVFSLAAPAFILCGFLLLSSLILIFRIRKTQPLLYFSLVWFLVTLLPQSVVPRPNVFFEHRLYLPSIGILLFLVNLVFMAGKRSVPTLRIFFFVLVPLLAFLTISRNLVWRDEVSLWKDTVSKSPQNARAWNNLGHAEYNRKDFPAAESSFRKATGIFPRKAEFWYNLALAEQMQRKPREAVISISQAIRFDPGRAMYYHDRGVIFAMYRNYPRAIADLTKALSLEPGLRPALLNRARVYGLVGDTALSNRDLRAAGN